LQTVQTSFLFPLFFILSKKMLKPKEYNLADSNVAGLGSDLDKKIRQAAAQT